MFYAECIDIPGVHIFSKKLHEGGNNEPDKYKNWNALADQSKKVLKYDANKAFQKLQFLNLSM